MDAKIPIVAEFGNTSAALFVILPSSLPGEVEPRVVHAASVHRCPQGEEDHLAMTISPDLEMCGPVEVEVEVPRIVDLDDAPASIQVRHAGKFRLSLCAVVRERCDTARQLQDVEGDLVLLGGG